MASPTITRRVKLNLVGNDAAAFALLGRFQKAARTQGWTTKEIVAVMAEASSKESPHHLLATILKYADEE